MAQFRTIEEQIGTLGTTVEGDEITTPLTLDGQTIIDTTNAEALLVRADADGGDVLAVDTSTLTTTITGTGVISGLTYPTSDGSANQVIQTNGAGTLSFATVSSASLINATAGATGADFTTIGAAITAGHRVIFVTDDTTETGDLGVAADGLILYIDRGVTVDMQANQFVWSAAGPLTIIGAGTMDSEITYAYSTNNRRLFADGAFSTSVTTVRNILFDNNSANPTTRITQNGIFQGSNLKFDLPNLGGAGLALVTIGSYVENVEFVGGGTSCSQALLVLNGGANNVSFSGTWSTTTQALDVFANTTVSNVRSNSDVILQISGGYLVNVTAESNDIDIEFNSADGGIINADLGAGDIDPKSNDNWVIENVTTTGGIDLTDSGATNGKISRVRVTSGLSIAGKRHKISDSDFLGGITITGTGDDNCIAHCQVGADGGGGATTITINSGADRNRVVGCMTDAAISDSGTDTASGINTIY